MKIILFVLMIFYGCNGTKNKLQEIKDSDAMKGNEKFEDFFNKFNSDTVFQKTRLHNPVVMHVIDDESNNETYVSSILEDVRVSFNQKDWNEKVSFPVRKVSKDTIVVDIKGIDTGIWIEHYFVSEKGLWYLHKIRDLSD